MSFSVRPVRQPAPRYPLGAGALAVILASTAAFGCGTAGSDVRWSVQPDEPEEWVLSCVDTLQMVADAAQEREWRVEGARDLWDPDTQHLGLASVLERDGHELLLLPTEDPQVIATWEGRLCPVVSYDEECDEVRCGEEVEAPCGHLLELPCPWTGGSEVYERHASEALDLLDTP